MTILRDRLLEAALDLREHSLSLANPIEECMAGWCSRSVQVLYPIVEHSRDHEHASGRTWRLCAPHANLWVSDAAGWRA